LDQIKLNSCLNPIALQCQLIRAGLQEEISPERLALYSGVTLQQAVEQSSQPNHLPPQHSSPYHSSVADSASVGFSETPTPTGAAQGGGSVAGSVSTA